MKGVIMSVENEIEVKCNISVRVKFKDYGNAEANNLATRQIMVWLEEVLNEDEHIPLFVASSSGELTTSKKVLVSTPNS